MCGICGFNWQDEETVSRMSQIMRHRGPDQSGLYSDSNVSLGHQRLSIIDLTENGRQPMSNEDGNLWVVFNGEVYNHRDIRKWLERKGHTFKSNTDTEVIVHGYEELGVKFLDKLNGMFAFAIWDRRRKTLFVARDRLGEKPLYYSFHDGRFIFASEIKAILNNPTVCPEVDEEALYYFLGFEFVPAPLTMFKGIRKLPAGNYLFLSNGKLKQVQYWDLPESHTQKPRKDWEEELRDRLETAVSLRMESDVPLGAFLSGGIDSSSVVAMMRRATNGPIRTFSLGYHEDSFSEFEYARRVADHFGTDHSELIIDPITPEVIESVIWHLDEPMSEFSALPYYLICKKAREHVTVCLSGEGGDEIFVGYDRFKASKARRILERFPHWMQNGMSTVATAFPDRSEKKGPINSLKRFFEGTLLPAAGGHMCWQYFLNHRHATQLFTNGVPKNIISESLNLVKQTADRCASEGYLDKEIYAELRFMMPENSLMKVDKMSMSHSLEIRAPLLDHELVEFVSRTPSNLKLEGWTTKSVFKSTMKRVLPDGIAYRSKHGYSFPIKHWLRGKLRVYCEEVLMESPLIRERFDRDYINILLSEHLSERQNHSHILWSLMNLAIWHRKYLSRKLQ